MTADSSTTTITHSGEGGINSPSRPRSLPSPWAEVVRGGGESESFISRSPRASEKHSVLSYQLAVFEPAPGVVAADALPEGPDGSNCGNAGCGKKSAWNKLSANGAVEGRNTPVMGAASWPALSESTRPVPKSLSLSEKPSKPSSDGLVTDFQAPVISHTHQKSTKTNANNHSNTTNNHPARQRSMRRGGSASGASTGYSRPPPSFLPPLPPPFPFFDMTHCNFVPVVLELPVRQQPLLKGDSWVPRPMGVTGFDPNLVHDHPSNRNRSRRIDFNPRPHGGGGLRSNGFGVRLEHHDYDWRGPRSPACREVQVPRQMVPPPPPLPTAYFHPGPAFAAQPIRPCGTFTGYEMAASFLYYSMLPPEPYMIASLLPQAAPPPMVTPVMDPPLHVQILDQIEYYFSDANLVKDVYLKAQMDGEGWVPISLIAGFRRVQILTTDVQLILNSLKDSNSVEIQGEKLRRRNEWRKWVRSSDNSINNSVEETSIQKLIPEEVATKECTISDEVECGDHKGVGGLTDSSKLANGKVSTVEPCLSHI